MGSLKARSYRKSGQSAFSMGKLLLESGDSEGSADTGINSLL